jgi:hypothetical protein
MTARHTNIRLAELGLHAQDGGTWQLTEAGTADGVYLDTGKRHGVGEPIQQIKWRETVLALLGEFEGPAGVADGTQLPVVPES